MLGSLLLLVLSIDAELVLLELLRIKDLMPHVRCVVETVTQKAMVCNKAFFGLRSL